MPLQRTARLALALLPLAVPALDANAQATTTLTPIAEHTWLARDPAGNVVVTIGKGAAVVLGPQTTADQPALQRAIARISAVPVRFVVITASSAIDAHRDAGWGKAGATVIAEEHAAARMGGMSGAATTGPSLGFSEVQQVHLEDEDIHIVRQEPGNTNADFSAHYEAVGVIYLGDAFVTDRYPTVDEAHGGTLAGLIATSAKFMGWGGTTRFVPGRGDVTTAAELRAYHDMLVDVRDRVRALKKAGRSIDQAVAAHPTAAHDARWGKVAGAADALVRAAYHDTPLPKKA